MIRNPVKLAAYALAGWLPGGKRRCLLCGHAVWRFMPYSEGQRIALMDALEGVGSDIEHYECPRCGSNDRERHLWLYMQSAGIGQFRCDAIAGGTGPSAGAPNVATDLLRRPRKLQRGRQGGEGTVRADGINEAHRPRTEASPDEPHFPLA